MLPPQTCIMFDLDGTLAPSKGPISEHTAKLVGELLKTRSVAIVSGGAFLQFKTQVVDHLPVDAHISNLLLLPTSGAAMYRWSSEWKEVYLEALAPEERMRIREIIESAIATIDIPKPEMLHGEQLEDRIGQMTLSWLGQQAPIEAKKAWDPDYSKRKKLVAVLTPLLPECFVHIGGITSIDITKRGVDKGYGIKKTAALLGISLDSILYVGDALFEGGNDYAAVTAGVATLQVSGPEETEKIIEGWLSE